MSTVINVIYFFLHIFEKGSIGKAGCSSERNSDRNYWRILRATFANRKNLICTRRTRFYQNSCHKRQMVTEFRSEKKMVLTEALVAPDSFIAFKIFAILISIDISIKIQAGLDQIWILGFDLCLLVMKNSQTQTWPSVVTLVPIFCYCLLQVILFEIDCEMFYTNCFVSSKIEQTG